MLYKFTKEDIDNLKKEKESLKEFEEKINQSNLAKIIDNTSTFIDIVKEKFTKHKTIKKLIEEFEEKITKQTQEIFDLTNEKEEIKTNNIENINRINLKNNEEKEKLNKEFNKNRLTPWKIATKAASSLVKATVNWLLWGLSPFGSSDKTKR